MTAARNLERGNRYDRTSDKLRHQHLSSTAVEQSLQRYRVIGTGWTREAVLTAGKEPEGDRAPDTAHAVDGNRTDGIVDAQIFQQFNAEDNYRTSDSPSRIAPVGVTQ
jgi:hypothetical protein